MSLTEKLIIPFIDKNMKPEYISNKYKFVGCYTGDINHPEEYGSIYLLYEFIKGISLYGIFSKFKSFSKSRCIFIKEKAYYLYVFKTPAPEIKKIYKGIVPYSSEASTKLLSFWIDDKEIVQRILVNNLSFLFSHCEVPEEDYREPNQFDIDSYKERLALSNESQPFICIVGCHGIYLRKVRFDFFGFTDFDLDVYSGFWKIRGPIPSPRVYPKRASIPSSVVSSCKVGIPVTLNIDFAL